jgi:hypothetical protein
LQGALNSSSLGVSGEITLNRTHQQVAVANALCNAIQNAQSNTHGASTVGVSGGGTGDDSFSEINSLAQTNTVTNSLSFGTTLTRTPAHKQPPPSAGRLLLQSQTRLHTPSSGRRGSGQNVVATPLSRAGIPQTSTPAGAWSQSVFSRAPSDLNSRGDTTTSSFLASALDKSFGSTSEAPLLPSNNTNKLSEKAFLEDCRREGLRILSDGFRICACDIRGHALEEYEARGLSTADIVFAQVVSRS